MRYRKYKSPTVAFLSLAAIVSSCGGQDDNGGGAADSGSGNIDASPFTFDASTVSTVPDLSGTWALREKVGVLAALPIVGVVDSATYSIRHVAIVPDGANYESTETLCSITMDTGTALAMNRFSDEYVATRVPTTYSILVEEPASVVRQGKLLTEGVSLVDPVNDALPTTSEDERVIDEDGDGNPGFTINVEVVGLGTGKIYAIQRSKITMLGSALSPDRVAGPLDLERFESVVVGSTNSLFEPPEPPTPNAAASNFVMVRMPSGSTCVNIVALDEESLFGPR